MASTSLPARPSLESLRKQAKALARAIAEGDAGAIARARAHLPGVDLPVTQRRAQLVIAREYGFAGWPDLTAEVRQRLGQGLAWAVARARRLIHDNDVERLAELLAKYPALLSWHGEGREGGLLGMAADAYGDSFDPDRERVFTRAACAERLIDAGAVVLPSVCEGLIESRARGLLQLFQRKGRLPPTLMFQTALGDLGAVRASLEAGVSDRAAVTDAFLCACRFEHVAAASVLLERSMVLDPDLGTHVEESGGGPAFITTLIDTRSPGVAGARPSPWHVWLMQTVRRALDDGDLTAFVGGLRREPWLVGEAGVAFQAGLVEQATLADRGPFISALFDLDPALLGRQPPPRAQAIEFALTYARPHLMPLLTRVWPLPDDLPHAAGLGQLSHVTRWFHASGAPALGDLASHYPYNDPRARGHLQWDPPTAQQVLDTALAFAVINRHFEVASFLLARGADINTDWNSHEPASILHHLVFAANYDSMQFLIDRGIDMTLTDYRWHSTAEGWARYGKKDETMAQWLAEAERQRTPGTA